MQQEYSKVRYCIPDTLIVGLYTHSDNFFNGWFESRILLWTLSSFDTWQRLVWDRHTTHNGCISTKHNSIGYQRHERGWIIEYSQWSAPTWALYSADHYCIHQRWYTHHWITRRLHCSNPRKWHTMFLLQNLYLARRHSHWHRNTTLDPHMSMARGWFAELREVRWEIAAIEIERVYDENVTMTNTNREYATERNLQGATRAMRL